MSKKVFILLLVLSVVTGVATAQKTRDLESLREARKEIQAEKKQT